MPSRPGSAGLLSNETTNNFIPSQTLSINNASVAGPPPFDSPVSNVTAQGITEDCRCPAGRYCGMLDLCPVPAGSVPLTDALLDQVVNRIDPPPIQTTAGHGPAAGEQSSGVVFATPIVSGADQYFFPAEAQSGRGQLPGLSATMPSVGGIGSFVPDVQSWPQTSDPPTDWLPVGTDIVGGIGPFVPDLQSWAGSNDPPMDWLPVGSDIVAPPSLNGDAPTFSAAFSSSAPTVAEPGTLALAGLALIALTVLRRRRQT
jgi:MYXO-CTERM domain-containing protein